jgi:hypothetical protein
MRNRLLVLIVPLLIVLSGCIGTDYFALRSDPDTIAIKDRVNAIPYAWGLSDPAMQAFELVARQRGWADTAIEQWKPFVNGVMQRESAWCYNVRRGALSAAPGIDCSLAVQGPHTDSGFGQVTPVHYAPGHWMCAQEGLCSANQIVESPWNSMIAFVSLVEHSGRQPWCYTARLRAGPACRVAPAGLPK